MSEKDFLSQFSSSNKKPDSFKEEVRTPVQKNKKPVNIGLIIGLVAALILGAVTSYFLFFAPKIPVPYFVGSSKSDVAAWVKQQGIEPSGIIFKEKYDFDTDKDTILSQDIESGKKVGKDAKITFELSKGADPDEKIAVPDLMNMSRTQIQEWANENKLSSVRFVTAYSDKVEEGYVIKTNKINEDQFKRSSSLEITISKGPQPAGVVKMEDFVNKYFAEAETWAKNNKIEVSKTEQYSETVEAGKIISQSVVKDKEIKQGDTVIFIISKGKAIVMPDMGEWSQEDIMYWCGSNGVGSKALDAFYNYEGEGECIEQYPESGTVLSSKDRVEYRLSRGRYIYFTKGSYTYDEYLDEVCLANLYKANLRLNPAQKEFSDDVPVGQLISYPDSTTIGSTLNVVESRGRNRWVCDYVDSTFGYLSWNDIALGNYTEDMARAMCSQVGNYKFEYASGTANRVIGIKRSDTGYPVTNNTYVPDDCTVIITIGTGE